MDLFLPPELRLREGWASIKRVKKCDSQKNSVCQWTQNMDLCSTAWLMSGISWAEHPREIRSSAWAWDLLTPCLQTGRQQGLNRCSLKASKIFKFTKQSLPHQFCPFPLWLCPGSLALSSSGGPQSPRGWDVLRLVVSFMEFGANTGWKLNISWFLNP